MNRGSSSLCLYLLFGAGRFNEAPIHESGKCGAAPEPSRLARCFNEAPIHESGKCGCPFRQPIRSMRLQ